MALLARLFQAAHVVGQAGQAEQAAVLVEHGVDLLQAPAQGARQVTMQVGVDIAAAGAHHQAFQRGQAHAGVAALAVDDGAGGAAVAQVRREPAAGGIGHPSHLRGALADVAVAGAMEAVAAHTVLAVQLLRHRVAIGVLGQALVEGGVEYRDLRQLGEQLERRLDALQVGRVVQRCQRRGGADRQQADGVDATGRGEMLAAVHHAVADAMQLAAGGVLHQRQQVLQGCPMVTTLQQQTVLLAVVLPVQHRLRAGQALGQAAEDEVGLLLVDQGELDRRAATVDDQDVA